MMKEVEFQSRGMTIRGWQSGEGVPVISVHGWLDNANTWRPMVEGVEGCCWVSIDMPGHGRSGHVREGETYHFVDYAPVILDVADQLGWEQFHVVGHSMGGSVVMLLGATFPERILSVTMMDSYGPASSPEGPVETLRQSFVSRRARRGKSLRTYPSMEALADKIRAGNTVLSESAIQCLLERMAEPRGEGFSFSYDMGVRDLSPMRFSPEQVGEFIAAVQAPMLVVRAAQGAVLRYGKRDEFFAKFPNVQVVDVEGNHHVHLNEPDKIRPIISGFIHRHAAAN